MAKKIVRSSYLDHSIDTSIKEAGGVVLTRKDPTGDSDKEAVYTNVPHYVERHSPCGYEWGYGGSGPADLALNIVEAILRLEGFEGQTWTGARRGQCFMTANVLHQPFKWAFVTPISREGGFLPYDIMTRWVKEEVRHMARFGG